MEEELQNAPPTGEQASGEPGTATEQAERTETTPKAVTAPPLPEGQHYVWGTGRRKKAIARVRIRPGTGKFLVNKREIDAYFTESRDREAVVTPLTVVDMLKSWDVWANVKGGGYSGQAGAVTLGLARALSKAAPQTEAALREKNLMTRDARMKERKKFGQKGARKRFQFSKR